MAIANYASEYPTHTNSIHNQTGIKKMTFTNTDCVEFDWCCYDVWGLAYLVNDQVDEQVDEQMKWEVGDQIYPIQYKITQKINK